MDESPQPATQQVQMETHRRPLATQPLPGTWAQMVQDRQTHRQKKRTHGEEQVQLHQKQMGQEGEATLQDQKGHQRYPREVGRSGQSIRAIHQPL